MNYAQDPRYDTDLVNKAYVDKKNKNTVDTVDKKVNDKSKNFGVQPNPPYNVNDTYMDGKDIYICINGKDFGNFDPNDWKLASDYIDKSALDNLNKSFDTQPVPPYKKGDLWTSGPNGEFRRCVNSRESGTFVESDWENATSYDNTSTTVENGLVTTGTIQVVNGGTVAAGMTGNDSGDNAIRFWAGATSGNKGNASFRVTQGGYLYSSNGEFTGKITANSGKIGGWAINDYKIYNSGATSGNACCMQVPNYEFEPGRYTGWVFAAGATSHSGYGDAKFRVYKDGSMYSTAGSIGGWAINASSLSSGQSTLNTNGKVYFYPQAGTQSGRFELDTGVDLRGPGGTLIAADGGYSQSAGAGNIRMYAPYNINMYSNAMAFDPTDYGRIKNIYFTNKTISFIGRSTSNHAFINSGGSGLYLVPRNNGKVYIGAYGENPEKVAVSGSGPSSLCVKKNLVNVKPQYEALYSDLQSINMYNYDYKYKNVNDDLIHDYGFVIDEIEQTPTLKNYFRNIPKTKYVKDGELYTPNPGEDMSAYEKVDLKEWERDSYIKGMFILIKTLQDKIDKLENRIMILEGGTYEKS